MSLRVSASPGLESVRAAVPAVEPAAIEKGSVRVERATKPHSEFRSLLQRLGREIDRGEADVDRAVRSAHQGMDMGELIALQSRIYRYTESVDLAAKLVDRASSAVKTTLQGQ